MHITPVAVARNGFTDKFGIPRQSRGESCIETRIVFEPAFRVREALRGIEGYSHLWLIWGFSQCVMDKEQRTKNKEQCVMDGTETPAWSPTVRPPRLGGNTRMGVFATRSPFRPNALGLSSVRLLRTEDTPQDGTVLVVSGADLLDGTPIYDIKPYLSYSDSHPDARNGFGEATRNYHLAVDVSAGVLEPALAQGCPWQALQEILSQDPRPAYQHDPVRVYHLDYAGWSVAFRVEDDRLKVETLQITN